jgi:hypothetical protein
MRDRETIDSELRRVAAELRSIRERGGRPSSRQLDALLDERLGHPADAMCDIAILDEICLPADEADDRPPRKRRSLLLRLALRAAVPLSLITIAAVVAVMFALHHRHTTPQPTATPPSDAQASPAALAPAPAPFVPPAKPVSPTDIAEKALIDTLQHEGIPVPSHDYVTAQGHAVCDFLGRQPNVADAAHFVQQSTIWDGSQSANFVTAAVITYCPQFESTASDQMQQTYQKSLTNLQTIEGDLQGINHDLQGISDGLHGGG